jgi:hypothetical protein
MNLINERVYIKKIGLDPLQREDISKLEQFLTDHNFLWEKKENIEHLLGLGARYNYINENLYEKVFGIKSTFKYSKSYFEEKLETKDFLLNLPKELVNFLVNVNRHIETIVSSIIKKSYAPAYIFTNNLDKSRTRIPIHVHSNNSQNDTGNELCLTLCIRLNTNQTASNSVIFYPRISDQNKDLIHEHLSKNSQFTELNIQDRITIFVFDGKAVPHTTHFTSDLLLWCVFNGAILNIKDASKDMITYFDNTTR